MSNNSNLKLASAEKEQIFSSSQKALNEKLLAITRFENEEKNRAEKLNYLVEKQKQLQQQSEQDEKTMVDIIAHSFNQMNEEKQREENRLKQMEEELGGI